MNRFEGFITPHIGDKMFQCDDQFAINLDKLRFAIADGSSSDFFSKIYSRLLCDAYVNEGNVLLSESSVEKINVQWKDEVVNKLSLAGCRPGSFPYVRFQKRDPGCSTLIGLSLMSHPEGKNKFQCVGLGDSMMFFIPAGSLCPKWQFSSDTDEPYAFNPNITFGYTPVIANSYSTHWLKNIRSFSGTLENGVFILVTDGLAEWLLHDKDESTILGKFQKLLEIHSEADFVTFIDVIRKEEHAKNDDMTLLKIYIDDSNSLEFDVNNSILYDYRDVAEREEYIDNEIKKETAAIKQKLSAQNSISLSAEIAHQKKLLEKSIEEKCQKEAEKRILQIETRHQEEIKKFEANQLKESKNIREKAERETTIRLQAEFVRRENEIRLDEKEKVLKEMSSSESIQELIDKGISEEHSRWELSELPQRIDLERQKWIEEELPGIIAEERVKWIEELDEKRREINSAKKKIIKFIQSKIGKYVSISILLLITILIIIVLINRSCSTPNQPYKTKNELINSK